jgi:hypothetical protein
MSNSTDEKTLWFTLRSGEDLWNTTVSYESL